MKTAGLLALAMLAPGAAAAQAATGEYSTGNANVRIGAHLDESLNVKDAGPVSFVRVSVRISVPETSALALSLVSPKGTVVPLVTHRGSAADFGADEKGCGGTVTVLDLRTYVAVYVADLYLLGRPAEAKRGLDYALGHGLLYQGKQYLGTPAGSALVAALFRDLARWGYIRSK